MLFGLLMFVDKIIVINNDLIGSLLLLGLLVSFVEFNASLRKISRINCQVTTII
jgi:hypothetical protein